MTTKDQLEQKLESIIHELETFNLNSDPQLEGYLLGQKNAFMDALRIVAPNEYYVVN